MECIFTGGDKICWLSSVHSVRQEIESEDYN